MGCEAGRCKTSTPSGIFIVIPSLERWPSKAKEAPSPHEVRLAPLDTNPVFQSLREKCAKPFTDIFMMSNIIFSNKCGKHYSRFRLTFLLLDMAGKFSFLW